MFIKFSLEDVQKELKQVQQVGEFDFKRDINVCNEFNNKLDSCIFEGSNYILVCPIEIFEYLKLTKKCGVIYDLYMPMNLIFLCEYDFDDNGFGYKLIGTFKMNNCPWIMEGFK